jgi:hypothetical protein
MRSVRQEPSPAGYQLSIALDSAELRGMSPTQRREIVAQLTRLIMEAAGVAAGETGDDRV